MHLGECLEALDSTGNANLTLLCIPDMPDNIPVGENVAAKFTDSALNTRINNTSSPLPCEITLSLPSLASHIYSGSVQYS